MKYFGMIFAMLCVAFFIVGCSKDDKNESCISNLKIIGLALKQYAMDNRDRFPIAHNEAGLQLLPKDDYFTDENFCCPMKQNEKPGYYYIGGFIEGDSKFGRSNFPMAFDKPGNHKEHVNVLFMDGHVGSVEVPDYQKPEDVVRIVGEEYKLSQEDIASLLERCREMQ